MFLALLLLLIFFLLWFFGGILLDAVFADAFAAYTDSYFAEPPPTPEPTPGPTPTPLPTISPKRDFTADEIQKVRRSPSPWRRISAGAKAFSLLPLEDIGTILLMLVPDGMSAVEKQDAAYIMLASFMEPSIFYDGFWQAWQALAQTPPTPSPTPKPSPAP